MFAGFVARMEDTRLPKCVMFGELVGGAGCVGKGGQEKAWMGCSPDDLRVFGINADPRTTAAQDMVRGNGASGTRRGRFHSKIDRCRVSQGWTAACSCMPERDGNGQGEDSPKQAGCAGSLALVD